MKVTLTAYRTVVKDANDNVTMIASGGIDEAGGQQLLTAAGTATALPDETKYLRVATDTAIHIKLDGAGAANTDPMMPANTVEYFGVGEAATPSIIAA
jgi:hypothetical protein